MASHQHPELSWRGNVPIATRFEDPYFSLEDGLAETGHVFLAGNGLPARFEDEFQVAELGFGTGLNFLATWAAWAASGKPGTLRFTSFELFPMAADDMARALSVFPTLAEFAAPLLAARGEGRLSVRTPASSWRLSKAMHASRCLRGMGSRMRGIWMALHRRAIQSFGSRSCCMPLPGTRRPVAPPRRIRQRARSAAGWLKQGLKLNGDQGLGANGI